jgi:prevent-host-death family protein
MKIASVAEMKSQFSAFLKASAAGPVVVTRNGRPVAVLVGVRDEGEIERLVMAYSPRLQAILEGSRQQIREGDVLNAEEFWATVEAGRVPRPRAESEKREPKRSSGGLQRCQHSARVC